MSIEIEPAQIYVDQLIQNFAYSDAVFLAERLFAEVKNDQTIYLLARTYYIAAEVNKAYWLLKNASIDHLPAAKLLLAKCCFDLEKLYEAESVLLGKVLSIQSLVLDDFIREYADQAPFSLQYLAKICEKTDRQTKATECYRKSLKLNPFLWSSFEALCRLGERVDPSIFSMPVNTSSTLSINDRTETAVMPMIEPIKENQSENQLVENANNDSNRERFLRRILETPTSLMALTGTIINVDPTKSTSTYAIGDVNTEQDRYAPPTIKTPDYPSIRSGSGNSHSTSSSIASTSINDSRKTTNTKKENKSTRTLTKRSTRISKNALRSPCSDMAGISELPNKIKTRSQGRLTISSSNSNVETETIQKRERNKKLQSNSRSSELIENLINLFKLFGQAYQALSQFECRQAIESFELIPIKHSNTPWILSRLGMSYFYLHDYKKASLIYRELRQKFPFHTDGLEFYSTTLWHLKDEISSATLAHELLDINRKHPSSWCAAGNCLSLNHEYEKAIQAFKRAIQLAPDSDYAYTLLANEYSLIDELERAIACFRRAIQLNPRSYKAWNGIAMVYLKQEKFTSAEFHFLKAVQLFRANPDLMCHLAVAQHKSNQSEKALALLNDALKIDPKNPLCKFHKAGLLLHLERYHEALTELEELRHIAPKESLVYYLLSKVHRHLKNFHYSHMYMSWSMDLDPKGANNQLKENADKLYSKDEDPLLSIEDMASSMTEDDQSHFQSQSSLHDLQPMDSSEEPI